MESKIFKFFSFQWNRHCPKSTRNLWQFNLLPNNIAYLHLFTLLNSCDMSRD